MHKICIVLLLLKFADKTGRVRVCDIKVLNVADVAYLDFFYTGLQSTKLSFTVVYYIVQCLNKTKRIYRS